MERNKTTVFYSLFKIEEATQSPPTQSCGIESKGMHTSRGCDDIISHWSSVLISFVMMSPPQTYL